MNEITVATLKAMGVIGPDAREFDAEEVRQQVAARDKASATALEMYRKEKGLNSK